MSKFKFLFKIDNFLFVNLLFLSFFSYIFLPDFLYKFINGWTFNEWLINYRGGFVRRGLLGELIYYLNKINLDHRFFIFLVGSISLFHILYNVLDLIKDKNILYRIFIIFNPFGLFYLVQNIEFFFARRDLFYLNFLIYFGKRKKFNNKIFFIFSIFLILNYGIYIFLIISIFFFIREKEEFDLKKFKYSFFLLFAPLNILLLTIFSNAKNFEKLCSSINLINKKLPLQEKECWGAPNWVDSNYEPTTRAFDEISRGINYINDLYSWIIVFTILFLCLFLVVEKNIKFLLKQILYLSPYYFFFFFAQDWGRWIFLIFFIVFFNYSFSNNIKLDGNNLLYIYIFPILLNIYINIPTHLFQNINIVDIVSLDTSISLLFRYLYNLVLAPYIIVKYGYEPPIYLD
jgi:hypothetical protein